MTSSAFGGGSGFALDDDEDLASMLTAAEAASEDDGDVQLTPTADPVSDFLGQDDLADEVPAFAESIDENNESMVETPIVEPVIETQSTPAQRFPAAPRGRVHVPTEEDQLRDVGRILAIVDCFRKLTAEEKSVTVQFVTDGEHETLDDTTLVVKVLNADPTLGPSMRTLRRAYDCDPVERAFFAIELSQDELHNLGELVSVFSKVDYDQTLPNVAYSRQVVAGMAKLGDREMSVIRATESVLFAFGEDG